MGIVRGLRVLCLLAFLPTLSGCGVFDLIFPDDDEGDPDPGDLGAPCAAAAECNDGFVCIAGTCGIPGTVNATLPCTATRDCASGLQCLPNPQNPTGQTLCIPDGNGAVGDACSTDFDCSAPLRCDYFGFGGQCAMGGAADQGEACMTQTDCLSGLWCGVGEVCQPPFTAFPPFAGVECPEDSGVFRPYFEVPRGSATLPDFFRQPFPSDARVVDGELRISDYPSPGPSPLGPDLVKMYATYLTEEFSGFSSTSAVTFRFSGDLDFATTSGATIKYVDLGTGVARGISWSYASARSKYACQYRLSVRTSLANPLEPGHTYAVVLTTGLKDKNATAAQPDSDMAAMLSTTAPGDADLRAAWDSYAPLRNWIATDPQNNAPNANEVVGAAVFTVADDITGVMRKLHTATLAAPAPVVSDVTVCAPGVTSPCDDGEDRACPAAVDPDFDEIHGRFTVPIFQKGEAPYAIPDGAGGGGIALDTGGNPVVQRTESVCFALTVPKGTAPGGGWPLMVYAHGTGGSYRSFIDSGVAKKMATGATKAAVFSFDGVLHGARRGTGAYADRDSDELVFNPLNPLVSRDNWLQGAVDVIQAFRVAGLTISGASFNATKVMYFGHSQGSNVGIPALAVSPATPIAILSGAGSWLTSSLLSKSSPVDIASGMEFLLGDELDENHPVLILFQTFFERSDSINYAPLLIRRPAPLASKHVYMSYGVGDTYSPEPTLVNTALALGVQQENGGVKDIGGLPTFNRPTSNNVTGGDSVARTGVVVSYDPAGAYDGHFVSTRDPQGNLDWTGFLQSWLGTGTPTLPVRP